MAGTEDLTKGPAPDITPERQPSSHKGPWEPEMVGQQKFFGVDTFHVLKASIFVDRGNGWVEFPLWLKTDVEDMPDFAVVESASVEWGPSINVKISVSLKMDYEMGRWFLDSELSRVRNVLVVQAGYPAANSWTPTFFGYLDAPQVSHDPTGYAITLSTIGGFGTRQMLMRYDMTKIMSQNPRLMATRREIIERFMDLQGIDVIFAIDDATGEAVQNTWLDEKVDGWWPQEQDIRAFIEWVCMEASMRCIMWPDSKTGFLFAVTFLNLSSIYRGENVAKELILFGEVDLDNNRYPLTNFSTDEPAFFMDRWAMGVTVADIDPDSNEEVKQDVDETTVDVPALEEESMAARSSQGASYDLVEKLESASKVAQAQITEELAGFALEALEAEGRQDPFAPDGKPITYEASKEDAPGGVHIASPIGRDDTEKGHVESVYKESMLGSGLKATLMTIGMPDAYPEMVVSVGRVGTRFDGKYRTFIIKHTIGATWDTTLEVNRVDFIKGSGMIKSSRPLIPKKADGELVGGPFFDLPITEKAGGNDFGSAGEEAEG